MALEAVVGVLLPRGRTNSRKVEANNWNPGHGNIITMAKMRTMCPISHAAHLVFLVARRQSSSVQQFVHVLDHRHLDFLRCRRSVSAHSSMENITKRLPSTVGEDLNARSTQQLWTLRHSRARTTQSVGLFKLPEGTAAVRKYVWCFPKHAILHGNRRNSVKISNNCYQHRLHQNNFSSYLNLNLNLKCWHYRDSFRCSKMPYTFNFSNRNLKKFKRLWKQFSKKKRLYGRRCMKITYIKVLMELYKMKNMKKKKKSPVRCILLLPPPAGKVFNDVCLFVFRIMQKLLNWFSQNSVERWHEGRGRYD